MTDKRNENNGASEVDQIKDAQEVLDETDDIEEVTDVETRREEIEDNLDRGEELYDGFGFDDDRDSDDDKLADDLETAKIDTKEIKKASLANKESDYLDIDRSENETSIVIKTENELATDDYMDDQLEEDHETIDESIALDTSDIKELPASNYKEIPASTRLVIKADNGDIDYKESHIDDAYSAEERDYILVEDSLSFARRNHRVLDFPVNQSNAPGQTPSDYQLKGIRYANDSRPNTLYNTAATAYKNYSILSIKDHYKSKKKTNKKGLDIGKIALGAAAAAGLAFLLSSDDDEGYFW
ncbi:hypothetical protein [uncultured Anaerococcus sp.]|uniref:hypothetical protein n=1 Tax=uncultured Anaerococcus sp. TaxID=293428 RepID=UPI002603BDF4|nr:hypothetical protein [uncultured Anaerococcus sp.]